MLNNSKPLKTSVRNKILMSFFLVLAVGGIAINIIFQNAIQMIISSAGLDSGVVSHISRQFTIIGGGVTLAGMFIVLFIALYISDSITRPIRKLTHVFFEIAAGKWDTRIDMKNDDEIGQLADGFNFMAERVEKALCQIKSAKDHADNILVSVPSILIILSDRLNILSTNMAFEKMNREFPDLSLSYFTEKLEEEIRRNLLTGETIKKEIQFVPRGQTQSLIFDAAISSIGSEDDSREEKARVLLTLTDITEQKKMKELVMQSQQDWEDTFNTIPDMITVHDADYNIIYANKAAKEMLNISSVGYNSQNKCYKFYHGTNEAPKGCPSCNCLNTKMPATFETYEPFLEKYIEIRSIPRLTKDNELIGLIHIVRDISIRKNIEKEHNRLLSAVTQAKIEWEKTFDSVMEYIILLDQDLRITRCNRSFADHVDVPVEQLAGADCNQYFPCAAECFEDTAAQQEQPVAKKEIRTDSGGWLYVYYRSIFDNNNNFMFYVIIAADITEQKRAQERIRESEEELKRKVEDLEKFYEMAVGRELKMKALKREIKQLQSELAMYNKDYEYVN